MHDEMKEAAGVCATWWWRRCTRAALVEYECLRCRCLHLGVFAGGGVGAHTGEHARVHEMQD